MYKDFYQLQADPFRLSPDHRFCFTHRSYEKAKTYMQYALKRAEGFVMITGKPGTGKTTLINDLLDDPSLAKIKVAMLVSTQLEADDLLRMVAFSFGLKADLPHKAAIIQELIVCLTRHYRDGRRALLIVDEAQDLSLSALEELRLLTNLQIDNQQLLQIFLLGQEELRDLMQEPKMAQGHQRIVAACHLEPLTEQECTAYITHRLSKVGWQGNPQISSTIFPVIHKFSLGIPRTINQICSRLFLDAFVEKRHKIGVNDIRIVLTELQHEQLIPSNQPTFPQLKAGDFLHLKDIYTNETEQPPKSGPAATEIRSPAAPVAYLKAPRSTEKPVNELPVNPQPGEPLPTTTAPIQPRTPENVTQAGLTAVPGASDRPTPSEPVTPNDKGTDPGQDSNSHFISLGKAPEAPDNPAPVPSETPLPKVHSDPAPRVTNHAPPEKPLGRGEMPHAYVAAPTPLVHTNRNRGYWLVALSLVGLLTIGVAFYVNNRASFDSATASEQASPTKPPESVAAAATPVASASAAANRDPQTGMTSGAAPDLIEQTRYVDKIATAVDITGNSTLVVEQAGLAMKESPVDNKAPESSSIDSGEIPPPIATTQLITEPSEIRVRQVLFPYRSLEIQPQFKEVLDEVADELKDSQYTVARIVGIIDNRGKGSSDYNLGVSIKRAMEVARYLRDRGIATERLRIKEDTGPQENKSGASENKTSRRPERAVEVTVLVPADRTTAT